MGAKKPSKTAKKNGKAVEEKPEVELTPKQQKEKRREEARARAAETRKIVTAGLGQWTGKLPSQLLNEHAQKMKWERVEYPAKPFGREPDEQWVASVVLARRNPKTKEIERVRFDPPSDRVAKQATKVEATNLAATYGMHRVLSHRNMKMMLPPLHRDLWVQLDADKASAKPHDAQFLWSEDPWQADHDRKEARRKFHQENEERAKRREQSEIQREAQKEAEAGAQSTGHTAPAPTKRVKFNNSLTMPRKTRAVIERVIRDNNGFRFTRDDALDQNNHPDQYAKLSTMLKKLGFNAEFVAEALEYSSTLSTALTWLLIHVPEDDVPKSFMPSDIGVTARVSSSAPVEKATAKLRDFGYSEDLARSTAEHHNGSLMASVVELTAAFAHRSSSTSTEISTEAREFWSEEIESLTAILEPEQIQTDSTSCTLVSDSVGFKLIVFLSPNYPESLPGIAIVSHKNTQMSRVKQLEATRQAAIHADTQLQGDYMIMALFQYMEDTFKDILKTPTKLAYISAGVTGIDEVATYTPPKGNHKSEKRHRTGRKFDAAAVLKARDERMNSPQGKSMMHSRESLPAWQKREEIAALVKNHQVCLITGETGSGKSTQTVQFVLDSIPDAQIVCTQPRRISAIGVGQRVADERLVSIGDQVGYVIRGEAQMSAKTQIRFVTSGVLLRMLQGSAQISETEEKEMDLDGLTHIFVDEVHERSLDSDFLLILLKKLVEKKASVKIVLMSATVDPKQFMDYFSPAKVGYTHITGRTFPVQQFYLDDVIRKTGYRPPQLREQDEDSEDVGKIIGSIRTSTPGRVDFNLVAATVEYIHDDLNRKGDKVGSILIFLSGADEIDRSLRAIKASPTGVNLWALPLHASLPPAEQRKVFRPSPPGQRKVIASTNVAETSITISDIVAVIDSGRVKETVYDPVSNVTRLVDTWTSQAAATQRKGRAGRVRAGECYKLYTENAESQRMPPRPVPEILRSPLEVLYLNVKAMGISSVEKFLARAIDPPKETSLDTARNNLIAYGALDSLHKELTPLGRHISMIPTDPRTAKLLILSALMGCLNRGLTVAAILSLGKLPFRTERDDQAKNERIFSEFEGVNGDLIAGANAYEQWETGKVDKSLLSSVNVCRDIRSTRRQLLGSLVQIGFLKSSADVNEYAKFDASDSILRTVIGASLQPQLVELVFPQQKYTNTATGAIQIEGVDDSRAIKLFSATGERVFQHPRSLLFGQTSFVNNAHYMSYGGAIVTSKHFIAENTPLSIYGLMLFASRIGVDPLGNGVIIDKWTGLKCWPRAGILLQFLQQLLGDLMDRKFRDPSTDYMAHPVIQLVHDLLESENKPQGVGLVA